jgi:hypothetical protein
VDDPWGIDDPPAVQSTPPLPPRLARLAEVQRTRIAIPDADLADWGFPRADELPEVQTLASEGWRPLHEAPLYCLLPAAWPATHRTWVPDRRPRVSCGGTTASYYGSVMPLPEDSAWEDDTAAQEAREAGLPAPPTGRLWLIRSPWPRLPVSAIYELVSAHAERRRDSEGAAVYRAARTVFGWDEDTAIAACPAHLRGLLDDWAAVGRIGENAGAFVESRLTPGLLDQLRRSTGLDEARALAWLDSLGTDVDDETIAFITRWRAAGLPGDPPTGADRFLGREPQELRRWLDAGFDLYAADLLRRAGLDTALTWREAGFSEQDTYELLHDDPDLGPAEAHEFDTGPAREQRRGWIYFGFDADQAAAWASAGVTPSRARVWRACSKTPADVRPGQRFPPELTAGRTYLAYSGPMNSEYGPFETAWDEIPDPPGTRGRRARRYARDPHPWINTD